MQRHVEAVRELAASAFEAGCPMLAISLYDVADQFDLVVKADLKDQPALPADAR